MDNLSKYDHLPDHAILISDPKVIKILELIGQIPREKQKEALRVLKDLKKATQDEDKR